MTREEAIKSLKNIVEYWTYKPTEVEAAKMVIDALRPVSREKVEKVWRGCEKCNGAGEYSRYAENLAKILLAKYCPHCGRPLTDEAAEMVMKRLEVLKDDC